MAELSLNCPPRPLKPIILTTSPQRLLAQSRSLSSRFGGPKSVRVPSELLSASAYVSYLEPSAVWLDRVAAVLKVFIHQAIRPELPVNSYIQYTGTFDRDQKATTEAVMSALTSLAFRISILFAIVCLARIFHMNPQVRL